MTDKQVQQYIDKLIKDREINIAKAYQNAALEVKSRMATLYEKYAIEGELTYAEMAKYNRLNSMYKNLTNDITTNWGVVDKEFKGLVKDAYNESYYLHGYLIAEDIGMNINFGLIPTDTIYSLYNTPNVSGLSLKQTLGNVRYKLLLKERQTIIQGFLQGESYADMAKRIQDEFNKSFNDALRIARTEGARAANEAQVSNLDDAENMGIEIDRIWLTGGKNIRDAHAVLHGVLADKEGYWHTRGYRARNPLGFGVAELDINCKCTVKSEVRKNNVKRQFVINDREVEEYPKWKKQQK